MTNEEKRAAVIKIYADYGSMSSIQASNFLKRKMATDISPSGVAGIMRVLYNQGLANHSKNEKNITIYWLTTPMWN